MIRKYSLAIVDFVLAFIIAANSSFCLSLLTSTNDTILCLNGGVVDPLNKDCACPDRFFGNFCENAICGRLFLLVYLKGNFDKVFKILLFLKGTIS